MIEILLIILVLAPLLILLVKNSKIIRGYSLVIQIAMSIVTGIYVYQFVNHSPKSYIADIMPNGLGLLMLIVIIFVSNIALLYSYSFLGHELKSEAISIGRFKMFYILTYFFIASLVLVTTSNNIALSWLGVELSTITSTFLVAFYVRKTNLEAGWKYFIINTIGVTVGLLGIFFLLFAALKTVPSDNVFSYKVLLDNAKNFNSEYVKIAFVLILVGFGTKVGLVPMHTWLPDAHSKAVTPISGILSSVLLPVGVLVILRIRSIVDVTLSNSNFTSTIIIVFAVISILYAALLIVIQKNYKRLLAYSSIEHMGILLILFALNTPLAITLACYHYIFHALIKSSLFFLSGNIYLAYHSTMIQKVQGVIKQIPLTGFMFLFLVLAVVGLPPFGIFTTEFGMFKEIVNLILGSGGISLFNSDKNALFGTILLIAVMLGVVIITISFISIVMRLSFGVRGEELPKLKDNRWGNIAIGISIIVMLLLSANLLPFINDLITNYIVSI